MLLAPFGANSARFFTNAIDTRTNGVDVTASYRLALGSAGDLQLRAGYNNSLTEVVGEVATPPQLRVIVGSVLDRIERRRIECGQPRDSARLDGDWRRGRLGIYANPRVRHVLQLHVEPGGRPGIPRKVADRRRGSFRAGGYFLAVGVQNLFNVFRIADPPSIPSTASRHSEPFPFGMNGRGLYGESDGRFSRRLLRSCGPDPLLIYCLAVVLSACSGAATGDAAARRRPPARSRADRA